MLPVAMQICRTDPHGGTEVIPAAAVNATFCAVHAGEGRLRKRPSHRACYVTNLAPSARQPTGLPSFRR
ncbi:hypothetical protein XHV734_1939 [Xanthomonas hortorum pv. vitians]|nr:hypothetical protein XHV734_1939 [Xanthomonas hortorum pv. vitians]